MTFIVAIILIAVFSIFVMCHNATPYKSEWDEVVTMTSDDLDVFVNELLEEQGDDS